MAADAIGPTVTVKMKLEKFDGDHGTEPVEVIETEETMTLDQFLASIQGAN